ncbi:hypothetical protein PBY51_008564 [Eleginops maclovinus]|uniref:Uncharacterized protein n=1 Tax=Eleginops maclovinus TaxID=56733 RepID=A0AAN8ABH6_ELEMC|nr:hypothetical protein PBY51_008564 [Eleginops maclovinus]
MRSLSENPMRLSARLSPLPRRRDAHSEDTAAQKCAQLRARPGCSFTSRHPSPCSQHNGSQGIWLTLTDFACHGEMPCERLH